MVFGAGAVGSALAAYLSRKGHPVRLVGRENHVRAIQDQGGIRTISRTETFLAPVEASSRLIEPIPNDAVLMLTVQSQDLGQAMTQITTHADSLPVITWQNGIQAEPLAAKRFSDLYGGVIRFTATFLVPGEVRLRKPGKLILGRYPTGTDAVCRSIVDDLSAAGFEAAGSPDIQADKALKLLVNLVSGPAVLLKRTDKEPILAAVQIAVLEEARMVFDRAGIQAYPASGIGQTVDHLRAHFRSGGSAPDTSGGIYNSTWQNLYHRRPRLESRFYHGEILTLGKRFGVPTPVNARVLDVLETVREEGAGPEPFDRETFGSRFQDLVNLKAIAQTDPLPDNLDSLEI